MRVPLIILLVAAAVAFTPAADAAARVLIFQKTVGPGALVAVQTQFRTVRDHSLVEVTVTCNEAVGTVSGNALLLKGGLNRTGFTLVCDGVGSVAHTLSRMDAGLYSIHGAMHAPSAVTITVTGVPL